MFQCGRGADRDVYHRGRPVPLRQAGRQHRRAHVCAQDEATADEHDTDYRTLLTRDLICFI